MNDIKILADRAIYRAQHLKDFVVLRDENDIILNGTIRYDIRHRPGSAYKITVQALSLAEAESKVDEWIKEMRNAE